MKKIKDREGQIELLKKQSAKMKSKINLILLIFCICFLGGAICFIQYLLIDFYSIIGEKFASQIVAISQGIVTIFLFSVALGIILTHFLSSISIKYSKEDLLIDICDRIERLEKEIENLKRHNQEAQKGQPGQSVSELSGEIEL